MSCVYVIDSNFFIQAHRATYPLDVFPGFWKKIKDLADTHKIISIDKVKREIFKNDDELRKWCNSNISSDFWKDSNQNPLEYSRISSWGASQSNRYSQKAIQAFLDADEADAYLVAFTIDEIAEKKIVTFEIPRNGRNKIEIPDVCSAF